MGRVGGSLAVVPRFALSALDRRRSDWQEHAERILRLSDGLPEPERALLHSALAEGKSAVEIASLTGEHVRSVRRRIRLATARVASPQYLFVLRNRDQWKPTRRKVATACVLHGLSLREASEQLGISLYSIRRHYEAIVALYDATGA